MEESIKKTAQDIRVQDKDERRRKIIEFEELVARQPGAFFGDTDNCPLTHRFAEQIYVREIFIPKGTFIVGKIHKHSHPNFLMKGTVEVVTEGTGREMLTAPLAMISLPGTKRALRAITDLVWITVHHNPTDTQDLDELEEYIIAKDYEEFERFIESKNKKLNLFTKIKNYVLGSSRNNRRNSPA